MRGATSFTVLLYKYGTFAGCFFIMFPVGVGWYWGNLSVYTTSYIRFKHGSSASSFSTWTISLYVLFWAFFVPLAGFAIQKIGNRWTMLMGIIFNGAGLILGWVGLMYPIIPMEIGFGVLCGMGMCFIFTANFHYIVHWTTKHTCFVLAIVQNASEFGGFVVNPAMTWYVNPFNESPMKVDTSVSYFEQQQIIEKVPRLLLWFFTFTSILSLVGFSMLRERPAIEQIENVDKDIVSKTKLIENDEHSFNPMTDNHDNQDGMTVKQMLKSKMYCALLFLVMVADTSFIISTSFYKQYGLTIISDDQFLTFTGMTSGLWAFGACILTGIVLERFGVKHSMIGLTSLVSLSSLSFYFGAYAGKFVFYINAQLYISLSASLYTSIGLAIVKLCGKNDFSVKYFFVFLSSFVSTIVGPPLLEAITVSFGWFAPFSLNALINFLALLVCISMLPS